MCRSSHSPPRSPSIGWMSSDSEWISNDHHLSSRLSSCSSGPFSRSPHTSLHTSKVAPSESQSSSSTFFLDLQLSADDMTRLRSSLATSAYEPRMEHAEEADLVLSPPASPPPPGHATLAHVVPHSHTANFANFANSVAASQMTDNGNGKQPWKKFWPPTPGSPWYQRVESQRPDVLSFSFDPRNHLLHQNHPWQAWKDQHPSTVELDDEDGVDTDELQSERPSK